MTTVLAGGITQTPKHDEVTFEVKQFQEIATSSPHSEVMYRIMMCESGGNPKAKNPNSSAKGLYQIIDGTWQSFKCEGDPYNGEDNKKCAEKIAEDSLSHWNESKNCWSK